MSSVVFIDSRVSDIERLLSDIDPSVQVVFLDSEHDGVAQIAAALFGLTGLDSIHVISHGSSGALYIGSSVLTASNLAEYTTQLARIGASLSEHGDLLLYGCDIASGDAGKLFVEKLATMTGVDVAASDDPTGASFLGGDATLEVAIGDISTQPVIDQAGMDISGIPKRTRLRPRRRSFITRTHSTSESWKEIAFAFASRKSGAPRSTSNASRSIISSAILL